MTETIPDPQIYRKAAELLRVNGWHQGGLWDQGQLVEAPQSRVCLVGAVQTATNGLPWQFSDASDDALDWLRADAVRAGLVPPGVSLGVWNDTLGRVRPEVVAVLLSAASAAESARAASQTGGAL